MSAFLPILSRWFHVVTAALLIGGVFYARIVMPIALRAAGDAADVRAVLLRARRVFKMTVHSCVLFSLLSGTYNYVLNRPAYHAVGATAHGLIGVHMLLGLAVYGVLLWVLTPREPRATGLRWMAVTLGLLLTTVAVASTLKYAREHPPGGPPLLPTPTGVPTPAVVLPAVVMPAPVPAR